MAIPQGSGYRTSGLDLRPMGSTDTIPSPWCSPMKTLIGQYLRCKAMKGRGLILILQLEMTLHPGNVGRQFFGPTENQPHLFPQCSAWMQSPPRPGEKFTSARPLPPCLASRKTQNGPLTAYLHALPIGQGCAGAVLYSALCWLSLPQHIEGLKTGG